jgi:hypothetical protein
MDIGGGWNLNPTYGGDVSRKSPFFSIFETALPKKRL